MSKLTIPNDLGKIDYTYDRCLRLNGIINDKWSLRIPRGGYDACSNVITSNQIDAVGELTCNYEYNALHHLVTERGVADHHYRFDSLHNRISKDGILHRNNELNQLCQQGDTIYDYDPNGNQSQKNSSEETVKYEYDALDRMTAVIAGNHKTEYTYDSSHRRLKKTSYICEGGRWTERDSFTYWYQGAKEIGAIDKSGNLIEMRTLGMGINGEIGGAVLVESKDLVMTPVHDFRGNVTALINVDDGSLIECYRYTAFGEEQLFDANGVCSKTALCPWRFSSKRIDAETGWAYFGRRYYDAEIGKWTTPDPMRFKDSANLYCFVRNRPLVFIDPDGRFLSSIGNNYETIANVFNQSDSSEICSMMYNDDSSCYAYQIGQNFEYSSLFTVGSGYDGVHGYTFCNGVFNDLDEAKASAKIISDYAGGSEVRGVHNATYGCVMDFIECKLGLCAVLKPVQ